MHLTFESIPSLATVIIAVGGAGEEFCRVFAEGRPQPLAGTEHVHALVQKRADMYLVRKNARHRKGPDSLVKRSKAKVRVWWW